MTKRQLTLPTLCHHSQLEFALVAQYWLTHQIHGRTASMRACAHRLCKNSSLHTFGWT